MEHITGGNMFANYLTMNSLWVDDITDFNISNKRIKSLENLKYASFHIDDLCSQFLCIHQMWEHFHNSIHLAWVEDGL